LILAIGTDLASIARLADVLERHDTRFLARCFDAEEVEKVEKQAETNPHLRAAGYAKRWAAKEACAKALGLGIRNDIYLKDIIVVNNPDGQPRIVLKGGAKDRLTAITPAAMTAHIHVSLTDETMGENPAEKSGAGMALAFVVISAEGKNE
jgi:holo-[acyl-carrier protein] synthase